MPPLAIALILISTFMHAGWNLLLRSRRDNHTILHASVVIVGLGLGPALAAEFWGTGFPARVWVYVVMAGVFQGFYDLGLTLGYQSGHFSFVYPLARALPICVLALIDATQGHLPSPLAWLGIALVSLGCLIIPLESLHSFAWTRYLNRATVWVVVTAAGMIGYTVVDKLAADLIEPGPFTAARYGVYETSFSVLTYWTIFKLMRWPIGGQSGWANWKWAVIAGLAMFGAYWLILWSYQLATQTSYVVALRQFSIVLGVGIGVFLFHEPAPVLRIGAAVMIATGVTCVALG